jgi:transposase InsO family protein
MRVFGLNIPNSISNVRVIELSEDAQNKLKILRWHAAHGSNVSKTARHFTRSRTSVTSWIKRFERYGPAGLETGSRRPKNVRKPSWSPQFEAAVLELRRLTGWGKDKLVVLLRQDGWDCSTSMVGRVIKKLKTTGRLIEAPGRDPWLPRRPFQRPYGVRKPKEYVPDSPGAIVQVDTAHVVLFNGFRFKHFTACDVFSRWQVLEVHDRATAHAAAGFLDTIVRRMPFPVRAIQVDGGSEFMAEFEDACKRRGIRLFVLPPRSPKLNGHVERSNRTHKQEFYYRLKAATTITEVRRLLRIWEDVHNQFRPHQALGQSTPLAYLKYCA